MDWNALQDSMQIKDSDYPPRRARIVALGRVLAGEQYDHIDTPFSVERTPGGEYIPLDRRRPTIRTGWCRTVVDDSVSMLFGQGRWPCPTAPSDRGKENPTVAALKRLVDATQLASTMAEAATVGSTGSVAILFRVLANRPYFDVFPTACLTPEWDPASPRALLRVTEKRKVRRADLVASGYTALPDGVEMFWFQRQWDALEEAWFTPWPSADGDHVPRRDAGRSAVHGLGVVPMVWIKNLPGGDAVDGACTFAGGINTEIEADYQLSQGGRGLKYSSDPTLLIKEPAGPLDAPARLGGAASALIVGGDGDAKLLEISGSAADAVGNYVTQLHKFAMGAMHGDASDRDKLASAQSGRAMELMKQPLIWLTSRLRMSYGDGGVVPLLRLVCLASGKIKGGVFCGEERQTGLDPAGLALTWPPFFHPTFEDKRAEAVALTALVGGGVMSRRKAVQLIGESYDGTDVDMELTEIARDQAAAVLQGGSIA